LISVLTLFISLIASSRSLNKNVSTGAVIRAKRVIEPDVHKLLANYQTGGYKFRPGTEESDRNLSFMNTLNKSTQA